MEAESCGSLVSCQMKPSVAFQAVILCSPAARDLVSYIFSISCFSNVNFCYTHLYLAVLFISSIIIYSLMLYLGNCTANGCSLPPSVV